MRQKTEYQSAVRLCDLIVVMAGNTITGLRNIDIAEVLDVSPGAALKLLQALEAAGYTQRLPHNDKLWVLGPRIVQAATSFSTDLSRAKQRLAEVEQRYSRRID